MWQNAVETQVASEKVNEELLFFVFEQGPWRKRHQKLLGAAFRTNKNLSSHTGVVKLELIAATVNT